MGLAYPIQKLQDWITQQWVIWRGVEITPEEVPWLMGPFGNLNGIGDEFINQLAEKEGLIINRNTKSKGLIPSIDSVNFTDKELNLLNKNVIEFYEKTAQYKLDFAVKWNPFFKAFGIIVNKLFSNRINQLNIPTKNIEDSESLNSEIITLTHPNTNDVKYTIWFRSFKSSGQVIYSGIYGTCTLPSGKTCIKAVFPLPKGNATVIMLPSVGDNGELTLDSSGRKFGDAGFYFLLNDAKGKYWSKYIRSFRDKLTVHSDNETISAEQILTMWNKNVLKFNYKIKMKE